MILNRLNIDTNEVLEAAKTKWNFNIYYPGLVGGHCIGIDPYYLSYKAKSVGIKPNMALEEEKLIIIYQHMFFIKLKMN